MPQENNNFFDDLAQIVADQQRSLIALEELKGARPDLADDFDEMQTQAIKILADLEEIRERVEKENG